MPFFNLPGVQEVETQDTGCPPGYSRVGDACVNPLTEEVFRLLYSSGYEFEYYENAGELVGRYNLIANDIPERDQFLLTDSESVGLAGTYFDQNINITRFDHFPIDTTNQAINKNQSVLFLEVKHTYQGVGHNPLVEIQHPFLSNQTITDNPDFLNSFYIGEFHLITNTMKSVKRFNCNYQILQDLQQQSDWSYVVTGSGAPIIPSLFESDKNLSFVEFYMGWTKVPLSDRPPGLDRVGYPSIKKPILGTDWLEWKTLNTVCSSFLRVYDNSVPHTYFETNDTKDGHYILQTQVRLDQTKLTTFFNSKFDSSQYPLDTTSSTKFMVYQILIYPPSYYFYPAKNPVKYITPIPNFVNRDFRELTFLAPKNYKSDGNIHYKVEFFQSKNDTSPLFASSSYSGDTDYEQLQWYSSVNTLNNFVPLSSNLPVWNNLFDMNNGSDAENTVYIKYILSPLCLVALKDKSDIIFRIKQLDGTLIEPYITT